MAIITDGKQFHLKTKHTSYIFTRYQDRYITHIYWGDALENEIDCTDFPDAFIYSRANAFHVPTDSANHTFISDLQLEFSVVGSGDYRTPMLSVLSPNGSNVLVPEFDSYRIAAGKPALEGLPATYVQSDEEAQTLEITLKDHMTGLQVILSYTVFEAYDIITRHVRYVNGGTGEFRLLSAQSAIVDFYGQNFDVVHLQGDWARERSIEKVPVGHGVFSIDSKRGMSSHMHNPFLVLAEHGASEYQGRVYGFSLVYSGSFYAFAEGNSCGGTRVGLGINPFQFDWRLAPGETFTAPEVVMAYSGCGLNHMSQLYHRLYRQRLCRGRFRDAVRPMVINNWEGTSFHFDEEKLIEIARNGAKMGLELFVLDDGWFGKRDSDASGLGDWVVNRQKLPGGLKALADKINGLGMKFGLWFEPEMVSPDSDLYRLHPDWCIHAQGRPRTENRQQLVLDLSRPEIRRYVIDAVSHILCSANIEYVKWDCNRNITETASPMQSHQYVLGLYQVLETLTSRFPHILFESCSGGGGRFDPGMLYYMPQTWTSDNTAPMSRLSIQYGTSLVYPPVTMAAHVGHLDAGYDRQNAAMHTSAMAAMAGNFGYELDLSRFSETELAQAKSYVEQYKELRATIQFGAFYRIEDPFASHYVSWEFADDTRAVLFAYQTVGQTNGEERRIRLHGLVPEGVYKCSGKAYLGEALMKIGFRIPLSSNPCDAKCFVFQRE